MPGRNVAYLYRRGRSRRCSVEWPPFEVPCLISRLLRFWYDCPELSVGQMAKLATELKRLRYDQAGRKAYTELKSNATLGRYSKVRSELLKIAKDAQFDRSPLDLLDRQLLDFAAQMREAVLLDPLTAEERDRDKRRSNTLVNEIAKLFRDTYGDGPGCPSYMDTPKRSWRKGRRREYPDIPFREKWGPLPMFVTVVLLYLGHEAPKNGWTIIRARQRNARPEVK